MKLSFDRSSDVGSESNLIQISSTSVHGTEFCLVEFPGFGQDDEQVFESLSTWLKESYENGEYLSGVLYLHRILDDRQDGTNLRNLSIIKKLCGKEKFRNITIASTFWDEEDDDAAEAREKALKESPDIWGDLAHEYASIERMPAEREKCVDLLVKLAEKDTIYLHVQEETVDENKVANDTKAAAEMKFYKRHQAVRDAEELERSTEHYRHQINLGKLGQKIMAKASEEEKGFRELFGRLNGELEALEDEEGTKTSRLELLKERITIFEQQKLAPILRERAFEGERLSLAKEHEGRLGDLDNAKVNRLVLGHRKSLLAHQSKLDEMKNSKQGFQYISQKGQNPAGQGHEQEFCAHCLDQLSLFDTVWGKPPHTLVSLWRFQTELDRVQTV